MSIEKYFIEGFYEYNESIRKISGELELNTDVNPEIGNVKGYLFDEGYPEGKFEYVGSIEYEEDISLVISSNPLVEGSQNVAYNLRKPQDRKIEGDYFGIRDNSFFKIIKYKNKYIPHINLIGEECSVLMKLTHQK
jgi:hypothetical protein